MCRLVTPVQLRNHTNLKDTVRQTVSEQGQISGSHGDKHEDMSSGMLHHAV
jgi:hypothetical protein